MTTTTTYSVRTNRVRRGIVVDGGVEAGPGLSMAEAQEALVRAHLGHRPGIHYVLADGDSADCPDCGRDLAPDGSCAVCSAAER